MNIGLVIPIFNLCEYRLRNLSFVLNHISKSALSRNIEVVEQESDNRSTADILQRFPNISYTNIKIEGDAFNKSKLLNKFIPNTKYDYIWMLDVDVYLDIDYVISQLPTDVKLVRPFELIYSLPEKETKHLFNTNLILASKTGNEINNAVGKYSFIIDKSLYIKIGGYDENYEGWGFQDLDLMKKIPKDVYRGYTKNIAFHLYHPNASREKYNKNKELFNKKGNFKKLIPRRKKILDKS